MMQCFASAEHVTPPRKPGLRFGLLVAMDYTSNHLRWKRFFHPAHPAAQEGPAPPPPSHAKFGRSALGRWPVWHTACQPQPVPTITSIEARSVAQQDRGRLSDTRFGDGADRLFPG